MAELYKEQVKLHQSSPKPKYRNIIFDLGAVLIYWNPRELIQKSFDMDNQPWHLLEAATSSAWLDMDRGIKTPEQFAQALSGQYSYEELLSFVSLARDHFVPLEAGLDILRRVQAQGYNTYVLSNLSKWAHQRIAEYDFLKTFTGNIFSYQVNVIKPEHEIYQILLNNYSLKSEECIFIDDMQKNIDAAKELGIDGIVCNDHAYVITELQKRGVL